MKALRFVSRCTVACVLAATSATVAISATGPAAVELVGLTKLQERETDTIRFMIAVSSLKLPPKTEQCMLSRSGPMFTEHLANLFSNSFTDSELREAVAFFKSPEGASAVVARRAHEKSMFDSAARLERIDNETTSYSPAVRKALEEFGKTAAGAKFNLSDIVPLTASTEESASDLRSRLLAECLQSS